jgi:CHAD domain-containing protein
MTPAYLYRQRALKLIRDINLSLTDCDPEAIHDVRVSIRRMIALNRILRNASKAPYSKKELSVLQRKFRRAGNLRDIQVHLHLLTQWEDSLGQTFILYRRHIKRREKSLQQYYERAFATIHLKTNVSHTIRRAAVCDEIQKTLNELYAQFQEKKKVKSRLHSLRITVKKLKYVLEIQQACYPGFGETESFRKYLAHLQDLLGDWHDIEMGLQHLNLYMKRRKKTIADSADHEPLINLMKRKKGDLLVQIESEIRHEIALKENVSVVLP